MKHRTPIGSLPASEVNPGLGYACAITAQVIWGGFPYFYSFLKSIDAFQLVAHRCVWGFVFVSLWMGYFWFAKSANKRPLMEFLFAISNRRALKLMALAALLSGINWVGFVWAVTHERALEASLGYYICPQVHILLGVIILGERLNRMQWVAVGLSAAGVLYISSFAGGIPWVGLLLAVSFGLYGLVKKKVPISVAPNLTIETGFMLLPAIVFLGYSSWSSGESLIASPWWMNGLLIFSGLLTIIPLAFYGTAVRHIPLSTVGLLQFVGPTLQFLCGVYLLGEPFDRSRLIGFLIVWLGVLVFLFSHRKKA